MTDQTMLERRRVEAMLLKHVHSVIEEKRGLEEADNVIRDAAIKSAREQGRNLAEEIDGEPTLLKFTELLNRWVEGGALTIETLVSNDEVLEYNVRRCRYAEMYADMGLARIGHLLSCNRDAELCSGFNSQIELTRTQTIMSGSDHCDFRYKVNKSKSQG